MTSVKEEIQRYQSVPTGTKPDPSHQQQHEHEEVSIKDGTPSDVTSSVTPSRDITASWSGVIVNGKIIPIPGTKSSGLAKPNSLNSIHRNGSSTSTLSNTAADTTKNIRFLNKARPHLHPNVPAAPLPRPSYQKAKFPITINYGPNNGRASSSETDISVPRDQLRSKEYEMRPNRGRASSSVNDRIEPIDQLWSKEYEKRPNSGRASSSVNDRSLGRDQFRSNQYEMQPKNLRASSSVNDRSVGRDQFRSKEYEKLPNSGRASSSVNDRSVGRDQFRSNEYEMRPNNWRAPSSVDDRSVGRDQFRSNEYEMRPNNRRAPSSVDDRSVGRDQFRSNEYEMRPNNRRAPSSVDDRSVGRDQFRSNEYEMRPNNRRAPSSLDDRSVGREQFRSNRYEMQSNNRRASSSSVNDNRSVLRDQLSSTEYEMQREIICGPRGNYSSFPVQTFVRKAFPLSLLREYNLPDFKTKYEAAKFYIIKSFNEDDVHKSFKYEVWSSTPCGNKKLNAAFLDAKDKSKETGIECPIFLFFSVNASRQFLGVAEMIEPVDFNREMSFWKMDKYSGYFKIRWHIVKDVPNQQFRHIMLDGHENRNVTFTRDTQEIGLKQGLEMLNIFKSYSGKKSIIDDYDFYDYRQDLLPNNDTRRPEQESYDNDNDNYHNNYRAREVTELRPSGSRQAAIIKQTKNLTLNPSGKKAMI